MHFWPFGTLFKQNWPMTFLYNFFFWTLSWLPVPLSCFWALFIKKNLIFFSIFTLFSKKKKIWWILIRNPDLVLFDIRQGVKMTYFFTKMALKHWGDPLCVLKWSNLCKESKKEKKITSSFSFNGCTQWLTQVRGILRGKSRFLPNELQHLSMLDTHH